MALRQLLEFLDAAVGYIKPDPAAAEETTNTAEILYHRTIVATAAVFGTIAAVGGAIASWREWTLKGGNHSDDIKMLLMSPILFGAIGIIVGTAGACLFAPRVFLTGPVGKKWMKLIGTTSVTTARIVCAAVVVVILGFTPAMMLITAFLKQR